MRLFSIAFLFFFISSCKKTVTQQDSNTSSTETIEKKSVSMTTLLNDIWVLESINDVPIDKNIYHDNLPYVEFHITDSKVLGFTGCNQFNGNMEANDDKGIQLSQLISTKKACIPPQNESAFLQLLQNSNNYDIREGKLYLYQMKNLTLTFKKVD